MSENNSNATFNVEFTQSTCFGCGPANEIGLRLTFKLIEERTVACDTELGEPYEGMPGYVHGGIIATMMDEAMSKALRSTGASGVTSQLSVQYLRPVPSREPIRIIGKLISSEGREHSLEASIQTEKGRVLAQGKGLFVQIKKRPEPRRPRV